MSWNKGLTKDDARVALNAQRSSRTKLSKSKGRLVRPDSYIDIWLSPDDFFYPMAHLGNGLNGGTKYVLEHRLIMAKHLNRCLLPWEIVHHRNGVKDDNCLENLELFTSRGKHNTQLNQYIKKLEKENAILRERIRQLKGNE